MGLRLKKGCTFTDRYGHTWNEYYAVIDEVFIQKKDEICDFQIRVFADREARQTGAQPLETFPVSMSNQEYRLWAAPDRLEEYRNSFDMAYQFALNQKDSHRNPVWRDWESDE